MDINQRYNTLLEAIEDERKAEEAFFVTLHENKSIKDKIEAGYVWYPIEIDSIHYATGENLELKVRQKNVQTSRPEPHKFKVGVSVQLFHNTPGVEPVRGVVSFLHKEAMSILTNVERGQLEDFQKGLSGIEVMYDEKPYQVMKSAINQVIQTTHPVVRILKHALFRQGLEDNTISEELPCQTPSHFPLNDSQKQALATCVHARYLSIIHGPPGTGKTTTLVALCKVLLQGEKRILVCASSNNAVDLLASRLHHEGIKVLRIGNVTRIHDDLAGLTIVEKMRNHADWQQIKKMKIMADQLARQAYQYKRTFTHEDREKRNALKKEAWETRRWSRELEERLSDEIIQESQVIATTLISASHPLVDHLRFSTVIIDEASQTTEPECWNAMLKGNRVVLAGDHHQLPPTVKSQEAKAKGLDITILDRLTDYIAESSLLTMQYRMNRQILGFSNEMFYQGKLVSSPKVESRTLPGDVLPVVFVDTAGCGFEEMFNSKQKSYKNEGEYFILREFVLQKRELFLGATMGIISPYAEQVRYMTLMIQSEPEWNGLDIEINTIDGFQGQEKDIIVLSLVRSNEKADIGFLKDARRLNVSLTRARKKLIIIGDSSTVGPHDLYEKLLVYIEKNNGLDSAWNYMKYD